MFSVNNFYDYLIHRYGSLSKSSTNIVYGFIEHGSKNWYNLLPYYDQKIYKDFSQDTMFDRFYGGIYLFDQEPQDLSSYYIKQYHMGRPRMLDQLTFKITDIKEIIKLDIARAHNTIICHSELNSIDIQELQDSGFLDVYYWYHGLISRDWFRHWKHHQPANNSSAKRFGMYLRDCSGSRKYRIDILMFLKKFNDQIYFQVQETLQEQIKNKISLPWPKAEMVISSDASAKIMWDDREQFQIQIVPETLFDTDKIFLTEKIFKPIVMHQPFILFGPPGSLRYMREYGFKTFSSHWDESYDEMQDHNKRFNAIVNLINSLYSLSDLEFARLMNKVNDIVAYNQKYFFSEQFEARLMSEMHNNFDIALARQKEQFFSDPGGNYFRYLNRHYDKIKEFNHFKNMTYGILTKLQEEFPEIYKQVHKKYNHLF